MKKDLGLQWQSDEAGLVHEKAEIQTDLDSIKLRLELEIQISNQHYMADSWN